MTFTLPFLQRLPGINKRYLVSQRYPRGEGHLGEIKVPLLLTAYEDLGLAKIHHNAVKQDKFAAIIDLQIPEHYKKIEEMLSEGSKYRLFWAVFPKIEEVRKHISKKYKDNMRRYITNHTTWRISKDKGFDPEIQVIFGELFAVLKYGREVRRVKFEDIEKA